MKSNLFQTLSTAAVCAVLGIGTAFAGGGTDPGKTTVTQTAQGTVTVWLSSEAVRNEKQVAKLARKQARTIQRNRTASAAAAGVGGGSSANRISEAPAQTEFTLIATRTITEANIPYIETQHAITGGGLVTVTNVSSETAEAVSATEARTPEATSAGHSKGVHPTILARGGKLSVITDAGTLADLLEIYSIDGKLLVSQIITDSKQAELPESLQGVVLYRLFAKGLALHNGKLYVK